MSGINSGKLVDQRVSVCKRCRTGVFREQNYTWQVRPVPGYIHVDCEAPWSPAR